MLKRLVCDWQRQGQCGIVANAACNPDVRVSGVLECLGMTMTLQRVSGMQLA
jgi:hypothetical protein